MLVARHRIDEAFMLSMKEMTDSSFESLPKYVEGARKSVANLNLLDKALASAAYEHVANSGSKLIGEALTLAAQARWVLFAAVMQPTGQVKLGVGDPVVYAAGPDESYVNIGNWLGAFSLNAICCDIDALMGLCRVPNDMLKRSTSPGSEFHYLYKDALCAYMNQESDQLVEKIMAALRATDPARPDVHDARFTLSLVVPQLEVFIW